MAPIPLLRRQLAPVACVVVVVVVVFLCTLTTLDSHGFANVMAHPLKLSRGTAQLHYLIPASHRNVQLCYNLVSSAVNRYPVPTLLGWNGTGELDAAATHLAKLRAVKRYLDALPPRDDADLALIVDGYDVIQQLPPDVVLERYFDIANKADTRLAQQLAVPVDEARRRNFRQTIFWGPDKVCWPTDWRAPRCWTPPPSTLDRYAFGPRSWNGDLIFADPRWLNSGTLIGPVADLRRLIDATVDDIAATHDDAFEFSESDQFYLANLFGRQEYWRSKLAAGDADVVGGPPDRIVPLADPDAELHMAVEYESALFQTNAAYEPFYGHLEFNESGPSATMNVDMFAQGDAFAPYPIEMPSNVLDALTRLYDAVPDAHPGILAKDWIRTVRLGVNYVTRHIYGLWHCTGGKERLEAEYQKMWWYPFAESLLKASVKSSQARHAILSRRIDGRKWFPKMFYPDKRAMPDNVYGGAWSDVDGVMFVPWSDLCGEHEEALFRGQRSRVSAPR